MIDLKKIIINLEDGLYHGLVEVMTKNKAGNSLFLLESYRTGKQDDQKIIEYLNINSTSLYTLKSRLYDKIQDHMTSKVMVTEQDLLKQVNEIHHVCYNNSKEIAVAFLTRLEKSLLEKEMHSQLLVVYSALKQLHLFSDKYFHYSQLYNQQIAFSLTLEKSNEILGNFNRQLALYDFSKSEDGAETLMFLLKGVKEQYALNGSRQIELIKYIIELQLYLYVKSTHVVLSGEPLVLLKKSEEIIEGLPYNVEQKQWGKVIDLLYFEYYSFNDELKNAQVYYEKVADSITLLSHYSHVCLVSKSLISKMNYALVSTSELTSDFELIDSDFIDQKNTHLLVLCGIHNAMIHFYNGRVKESINTLNGLLNDISLKDLHSINIELKLTLGFFYLQKGDKDLAETMLKSVLRKIKSDGLSHFSFVNDLVKLMLLDTNSKSKDLSSQKADLLTLFCTKNVRFRLMSHLMPEFSKRYKS